MKRLTRRELPFLTVEDLERGVAWAKRGPQSRKGQLRTEADIEDFHANLLGQTLLYAKRFSRYYSRTFEGVRAGRYNGRLEPLPTIDKKKVLNSWFDVVSAEAKPSTVHTTGGTTGSTLEVPTYYEELRARSLFNTISTLLSHPEKEGWCILFLDDLSHGPGIHPLSDSQAFNIIYEVFQAQEFAGFRNPVLQRQVKRIDRILSGKSRVSRKVGRPRILCAGPKQLKILTNELERAKHDPSHYEIEIICTSGNYLSAQIRHLLRSSWEAKVQDNYGMSEICGGASQCNKGNYHFDATAIAELLPIDGSSVPENSVEGEIVFTGLHPFQQALPLIRYRSSDYATFLDRCECGEPGPCMSSYLGRARDCIVIRHAEPHILSPIPLCNALEKTGVCSTFSGYERVYPRFSWSLREKARRRVITVVVKCRKLRSRVARKLMQTTEDTLRSMIEFHRIDKESLQIEVRATNRDQFRWIDL